MFKPRAIRAKPNYVAKNSSYLTLIFVCGTNPVIVIWGMKRILALEQMIVTISVNGLIPTFLLVCRSSTSFDRLGDICHFIFLTFSGLKLILQLLVIICYVTFITKYSN